MKIIGEKVYRHCCNICNKEYKSYQSIWNHNNKFHNNKVYNVNDNVNNVNILVNNNVNNVNDINNINNTTNCKYYNCSKCNKKFNHRQGKHQHEKNCKEIINNTEDINLEVIKLQQIKELNKQKEIEVEQIKELNKQKEIEIKKKKLELKIKNKKQNNYTTSFSTLNRKLKEKAYINQLENSQINSHNTNNSHNTQNTQNTQNNIINICGFGKEDISKLLSKQEIMTILNNGYCSLEKLIELTNCGKYNECKNIIIPNKKSDTAYIYNDVNSHYTATDKNTAVKELIENRTEYIKTAFDENKNKIIKSVSNAIENMIKKLDSNEPYLNHTTEKQYPSYIDYKLEVIAQLINEYSDKICFDISLQLENEIIL